MDKDSSFVEGFLQKAIPDYSDKRMEKTLKMLRVKPIMLRAESSGDYLKNKRKSRRKNRKVVPTRPTKLHNCKYEDFATLRELWRGYMKELLPNDKSKHDFKVVQELLLKADFHGADLKVVRAKCKSNEGIFGTVLTESKNMFQLVTRSDKVVQIPKANTIFEIENDGLRITLFGDQFCLRPAFRLTKKFKNYIPKMNLV